MEARALKIHIYCRTFAPNVGGMERLIETIAKEFITLGHAVHVVTETPDRTDCALNLPFTVYRQPSFIEYVRLARSSDVILSAPLSLRRLPAQILSGRKIFVSHPDRYGGSGGDARRSFLKRQISKYLVNIVPSQFMAKFFRSPHVILNPYDDTAFFLPNDSMPRKDIIFVGRLELIKGCHLLIEAFSRIAEEFPEQNLTIVGDGRIYDSLSTRRRCSGSQIAYILPDLSEALH
jgi:glycogen(starch) synthase